MKKLIFVLVLFASLMFVNAQTAIIGGIANLDNSCSLSAAIGAELGRSSASQLSSDGITTVPTLLADGASGSLTIDCDTEVIVVVSAPFEIPTSSGTVLSDAGGTGTFCSIGGADIFADSVLGDTWDSIIDGGGLAPLSDTVAVDIQWTNTTILPTGTYEIGCSVALTPQ